MIAELLKQTPRILAECAVAERLRRLPDVELHPTLFNTPLIYGPENARDAMTAIYREYLEVARNANLPLILTAPTWRLDASRVAQAQVPRTINRDAVTYIENIRSSAPPTQTPVIIGALVGPQNDCYQPSQSPDAAAAERFHTPQIQELASTRIDLLLAQTLPSTTEALGMARALSESGKDYLLSFCIGADGNVLDGTPLPVAMASIDQSLKSPPVGYFVNCTHPRFLLDAYQPGELDRLIGIQANGSSKDVTQLDHSSQTQADPVSDWAQAMLDLHRLHQVQILGGCCGTTSEHLISLAQ
ncbi:homocysteine S-methyltransferase family protein [Verrucomicrobiaceae bacterium N1E253]|uniref:Homocysteine S-methyltransferase family protein n=1 Tax=Oceaniferula marina TaxID=2748318 RepID=A0A851GH62_9BACT|nr:homocysteine S-methyltransferase family protein [Oceaniferula marina]NWK54585.1 homocysteine S-methyltransferase family protein [Oceaniferula marina]